jgi:CarD family transcriptional regulator
MMEVNQHDSEHWNKFEEGDYLVCPGHGVGQLISIEKKEIAGNTLFFYNVKIINNGMKIMVPVNGKENIRTLVSNNEIKDVFSLLSDHEINPSRSTWNRRYREYMAKINTGSLMEIADVLRNLLILKISKKLSFGEKRMVELCKELIVKEVALSTGENEGEIMGEIESIFSEEQCQ